MIALLILVFFAVIYTGPTFDDWRAARATRREFPSAKVAFMLPSICDSSE